MLRRRGDGGRGWGWREGVRAKVRHFNFLAIFWSNSRPLGLENSSNLIKCPHQGTVQQNRVMTCIKSNEVI